MEPLLNEHVVTCPYCWQRISLVVDASAGSHRYVEDCEVCCRPMLVTCTVSETQQVEVAVDREV
ncbi:MAG: CPXCG motif-containing cysteine-rich protein [Rhodothermia bacterium]|nr:CPXCG motif-containing cysteine-rich protein [Rhodothermia bacterium]